MEKLNINIFNLIILMGIIQGFIFGFIIIFNRKLNNKTNIFLALTSFSLSISNLQNWFIDSELYLQFSYLNCIRIPTEFLIIPMFYLFVNHYLEIKVSNKKIILLTIPFFIDFILKIILFSNKSISNNFLHSNRKILGTSFYEELFCFFYSIFLILKLLYLIKNYKKGNYKIQKIEPKTKWLTKILAIGIITCIFWITGIIFFSYFNTKNQAMVFYPLWISITIILYWLSYVGLFQSTIFQERKEIRKINEAKENNNFKNERTSNILDDFKLYIENNYFNPNLNIELVSNDIGISNNYLSQIINANNIKFNEYLNNFRIEKAKEMILSKDYNQYTITSIGLEAGFNSNASFYRAFKKECGQTPTEFRNKSISYSQKSII